MTPEESAQASVSRSAASTFGRAVPSAKKLEVDPIARYCTRVDGVPGSGPWSGPGVMVPLAGEASVSGRVYGVEEAELA
jgi:hypothetical protein